MKSSTRAKGKYNSEHYDAIVFRAGIGASKYISELACYDGKSKAQYIRDLIIEDATRKGYQDARRRIETGGGGVTIHRSEKADNFHSKSVLEPPEGLPKAEIAEIEEQIYQESEKDKTIEKYPLLSKWLINNGMI